MNLNLPGTSITLPRAKDCEGQACGDCHTCRQAARLAIVSYVMRTRFQERGRSTRTDCPEEQRYVRTTIKKMLDVAGLLDDQVVPLEQIKLSEWGYEMRQRQLRAKEKSTGGSGR